MTRRATPARQPRRAAGAALRPPAAAAPVPVEAAAAPRRMEAAAGPRKVEVRGAPAPQGAEEPAEVQVDREDRVEARPTAAPPDRKPTRRARMVKQAPRPRRPPTSRR